MKYKLIKRFYICILLLRILNKILTKIHLKLVKRKCLKKIDSKCLIVNSCFIHIGRSLTDMMTVDPKKTVIF